MSKIITHSGIFHADELLAIVILQKLQYNNGDIERVHEPTNDDLNDPNTFVIDVGKTYNPDFRNFDHHQDSDIPCSGHLIALEFLSSDIYDHLERLITPIDDVDRGRTLADDGAITQAIKNLNNVDDGFNRALNLMHEVFDGYYETALLCIKGKERFFNLNFYMDKKVVVNLGEHIPDWKTLAKETGTMFMITPSIRESGKYNLVSRNSNEITVPDYPPNATFVHNNRFMAVFPTIEDALNAAEIALELNC